MAERYLELGPPLVRRPDPVEPGSRSDTDRAFRWIAIAAAMATYGLIVFGGVVRVTNSGLGCPDWPLCYGQIIPPLNGPTLIEYTHRLVTMTVTPLILLTAAMVWVRYRQTRSILVPAMAAVVLLAVQIVLGGVTVLTELDDSIVSIHLGNAMLVFGLLMWIVAQAVWPGTEETFQFPGRRRYRTLVMLGGATTFGLVLIGALVRGSGAGPACAGFPACSGQFVPHNWLGQLHMIHRLAAVVVGLLVTGVLIETWRLPERPRRLMAVAGIAGLIFLVQFAVGIAQVTIGLRPALRALHLALATGLWGTLVIHAAIMPQPSLLETE